jgi:tyrosyl-DNA phosphodiesterase 1
MDKFNVNVIYQPKFGSLDYGTFHSKLMLLEFDDRLRIVVSSANLYMHDWEHQSQVIWLQDFWPVDQQPEESKNDFKVYLGSFMDAVCPVKDHSIIYRQKIDLSKYDFSTAAVHLVASVNGRHNDVNLSKFGLKRLGKLFG